MRMRSGKWLGLALSALMLVVSPIAAMAEEAMPVAMDMAAAKTANSAAIAADLGVLRGDGDGVTDAYLAKTTTRLQAAILYLRLLGKEDEALKFAGSDTFADASAVGNANRPVLAYLKSMPELGWNGTTGGKFDPNAQITSQQAYKVMLEALGYKSGTDFEYADTLAFAASNGLFRVAGSTSFANGDLATALVETLQAMPKGGTEPLYAQLVASKAIAADKAAALAGQRIDVRKAADGSMYLTDGKGMALYLFTKDSVDVNSCQGACVTNWPLFYSDSLILPSGLDGKDFGSFMRSDGKMQSTYKGWPLYYFFKDAKAGDALGEGANNVWFLIKQPFYTIGIGTDAKLGNYLVDSSGLSLYYFDKDPMGSSACSGNCLVNWPAFHADGVQLPKGLNASDFGEITRDDGSKQTTFKGYPLYYFAKDAKRGDLLGQGVGSVWYVVDPVKFAGTTTGNAVPAKVTINMKDYEFQSANVTVKAGTPIEFVNMDDMQHNAVASDGSFKTPTLEKGQTATITLTKPGVYEYICEFHAKSMKGTITVQ